MTSIPKREAEALIRDFGGISTVADRLGVSERVAEALLLSERPLPAWVHAALFNDADTSQPTSSPRAVLPTSLEEHLKSCSLEFLLQFADEHGLISTYERHGEGVVFVVDNAHLLLDEQRALRYLRGIIIGYATGTGHHPRMAC